MPFNRDEIFPDIEKVKLILRTVILKIIDEDLFEKVCGQEEVRNTYFSELISNPKKNKLQNLKKRGVLKGDPEDIVHMDWSSEWSEYRK